MTHTTHMETLLQEKTGRRLLNALISLVHDSAFLPFFTFEGGREPDNDTEWKNDLRKGKDVSWKYINFILRPAASPWNLISETHPGDQVAPLQLIKEKVGDISLSSFAIAVIRRMVKVEMPIDAPNKMLRWFWTLMGTSDVAWKYLFDPVVTKHCASDRTEILELSRTYARWLAVNRFREGRLFELPMWCGRYEFVRYYHDGAYQKTVDGNSFSIGETLAPFSDYLRTIDMTNKEIITEYLTWLKISRWDCNPLFFYAVAGDPLFQTAKPSEYSGFIADYLRSRAVNYGLENGQKEVLAKIAALIGADIEKLYMYR